MLSFSTYMFCKFRIIGLCLSLACQSSVSEHPSFSFCQDHYDPQDTALYAPRLELIKNEKIEETHYLLTSLSPNNLDFIFNNNGEICYATPQARQNILGRLGAKDEALSQGYFIGSRNAYQNTSDFMSPIYHQSQVLSFDWEGKVYRSHEVPKGIHHVVLELKNEVWLVASNSHEVDGQEEDLLIFIRPDDSREELALSEILDKNRVRSIVGGATGDWAHLNWIDYNPEDESLILSLRHQSAIIKLKKGNSSALNDYSVDWILGNPTNWDTDTYPLLSMGMSFDDGLSDFPSNQHYANMIPSTDAKIHILLFDNGLNRGHYPPSMSNIPQESRIVEYAIDEKAKTVDLVWEYNHPKYSGASQRGSVKQLPNGHRLILWPDEGGTDHPKAIIEELDTNGNTVFEAYLDSYIYDYPNSQYTYGAFKVSAILFDR